MIPQQLTINRKIVTGKYEHIDITVECLLNEDSDIYNSINELDYSIMKYGNKVKQQ